jgi:hypothetical protein
MGVLAAVDSRGEWERGGGVSWESSFTVGDECGCLCGSGEIVVCGGRPDRFQMTVRVGGLDVAFLHDARIFKEQSCGECGYGAAQQGMSAGGYAWCSIIK